MSAQSVLVEADGEELLLRVKWVQFLEAPAVHDCVLSRA